MVTLKRIKIIVVVLAVLTTLSFKDNTPTDNVKTGIYGVCNCSELNSSKVELTLNEDFTFHYLRNTNPARAIDIKGNWTLNGNTVVLKDYSSDFSIHDKWTVDKNAKCLKSRNGLKWVRLCHLKLFN